MAVAAQWDDDVEDGVYIDFPADRYFRQRCMGSSDWIRLHQRGAGWWWSSRHNPDYEEPKGAYRTYGSALHAMLLEGLEAYERRFAAAPDRVQYGDNLLVTKEDIEKALRREGFEMKGTSSWKKDDWNREARIAGLTTWDNVLADFATLNSGKEILSSLDDRMIRLMRDIAISEDRTDNEHIRRLLTPTAEHPSLAELTIFASVDGIRRRWRIDRLYPGLDMDLKSLGNWRGRPLPYEVGEVMARNGWDIQRADYHIGRENAYRLVREGRLFGGSLEQRNYLQMIVEENPTWDWMWLVYQKPDPAGRAPVIFPVLDDSWVLTDQGAVPGPIRQYGLNKLHKAIAFYRRNVAQFGLDRPWSVVEPMHFTSPDEKLSVKPPYWIQDDEPAAKGAYASEDEE